MRANVEDYKQDSSFGICGSRVLLVLPAATELLCLSSVAAGSSCRELGSRQYQGTCLPGYRHYLSSGTRHSQAIAVERSLLTIPPAVLKQLPPQSLPIAELLRYTLLPPQFTDSIRNDEREAIVKAVAALSTVKRKGGKGVRNVLDVDEDDGVAEYSDKLAALGRRKVRTKVQTPPKSGNDLWAYYQGSCYCLTGPYTSERVVAQGHCSMHPLNLKRGPRACGAPQRALLIHPRAPSARPRFVRRGSRSQSRPRGTRRTRGEEIGEVVTDSGFNDVNREVGAVVGTVSSGLVSVREAGSDDESIGGIVVAGGSAGISERELSSAPAS
ncbi:hypothetical protein GGX14DRAFT_397646 [Mycena pura]|uniref:Uncharacterized protein n=1 Tax=Mycena pura TaxID=153505 RepID=A0AAD6V8K2_9AGAR|nr:hypothetical protein GGX14DRAFT_397646 [Mycena pura]